MYVQIDLSEQGNVSNVLDDGFGRSTISQFIDTEK